MFIWIMLAHSFNAALNLILFQSLIDFCPKNHLIIFNSVTENISRIGSLLLDVLVSYKYGSIYIFLILYAIANKVAILCMILNKTKGFLIAWSVNRFFNSSSSVMKEYFTLSHRANSLKIKGLASVVCLIVVIFMEFHFKLPRYITLFFFLSASLLCSSINLRTAMILEGYTQKYRNSIISVDSKTMIKSCLYLVIASVFIMFKPADHYLSIILKEMKFVSVLRTIGMMGSLILCLFKSKHVSATSYHGISIVVYSLCMYISSSLCNINSILGATIAILWGFMSITKDFILFNILPSYMGRYIVLIYHLISIITSIFYNFQITQHLESSHMYRIIIFSHILGLIIVNLIIYKLNDIERRLKDNEGTI